MLYVYLQIKIKNYLHFLSNFWEMPFRINAVSRNRFKIYIYMYTYLFYKFKNKEYTKDN